MVSKTDLAKMSRKDLEQLKVDIDRALETLEARRLSDARAAAEKVAKSFGFTLGDLVSKAPKRKTMKSGGKPPKYADPENPEKTWGGMGPRPAWLREKLEAGASLDSFLR